MHFRQLNKPGKEAAVTQEAEGDGEEEEGRDELSIIAKLQKKGYHVKKKFSGKSGGGPPKKFRRENGKEENGD